MVLEGRCSTVNLNLKDAFPADRTRPKDEPMEGGEGCSQISTLR